MSSEMAHFCFKCNKQEYAAVQMRSGYNGPANSGWKGILLQAPQRGLMDITAFEPYNSRDISPIFGFPLQASMSFLSKRAVRAYSFLFHF
jgi:hypothetical protein